VEDARAVVCGDTLSDFGDGLAIHGEGLGDAVSRDQLVEGLRALLKRGVELVLPAHGPPTDGSAPEHALA
jgi:glyoxylase-like metal-dependent hydrolase (beta-lactamase superfamily II)